VVGSWPGICPHEHLLPLKITTVDICPLLGLGFTVMGLVFKVMVRNLRVICRFRVMVNRIGVRN